MQEADFNFDEGEWLAPKGQAAKEEDVIVEVLNDADIPEDMSPEERYKLLQTRYPEFDYLASEFRELRPLLAEAQESAKGKPARSLEVVKSWVLGSYVASLASYFAILTSPARDGAEATKLLDPAELREHEVVQTLVACRNAWLKVNSLKPTKRGMPNTGIPSPPEDEEMDIYEELVPTKASKKTKLSKAEIRARQKKEADKAEKARAVEQGLANLSTLLKSVKTTSRTKATSAGQAEDVMDDNRSDFGEEEAIDSHTAEEKTRRKKSLKFYTSQIVQKASRRAGAGRDAGGDMDIPYRERLVSYPLIVLFWGQVVLTRSTEGPRSASQCRGRAAWQEGQQVGR